VVKNAHRTLDGQPIDRGELPPGHKRLFNHTKRRADGEELIRSHVGELRSTEHCKPTRVMPGRPGGCQEADVAELVEFHTAVRRLEISDTWAPPPPRT
jgi:hypothetical protein